MARTVASARPVVVPATTTTRPSRLPTMVTVGGLCGVTASDHADQGPQPTPLSARTENR